MNTYDTVQVLKKHAPEIRARFGVQRLLLIGSVARGDADDKSDVDFMVSYEERPGYHDGSLGLKFYLEELLGPDVDLFFDPLWYAAIAVDEMVQVSELERTIGGRTPGLMQGVGQSPS